MQALQDSVCPGGRGKLVCILGHFGSTNFGNEITFQTTVYHVRRRLPAVEISCVCTGPEAVSAAQHIRAYSISGVVVKSRNRSNRLARRLRRIFIGIPIELYRWVDAFRALKGTHALIVPGTGLLTDAYGLLGWGPYNLFKWVLLAKLRGSKVFIVSVGAGPIYSTLGRWLIKGTLALADFRSYRDKASLNYLKKIGLATNGDRVFPDLVFSLPRVDLPRGDDHRRQGRPVVALGLMVYAGRYSVDNPTDAIYQAYLANLVLFAQWVLNRGYNLRLVIGQLNDRRVTEEFKSRLRASWPEYEEKRLLDEPAASVEQLLPQLAEAKVVVATRFHNVLLAMVLHKPVIAISFHHKCASLMSDMGLMEYCHDINGTNADKLIAQFQKVEENAPKLEAAIRLQVEQSCRALEAQYDLLFKNI